MAAHSSRQTGGCDGDGGGGEVGVAPTGLNRIKTRRVASDDRLRSPRAEPPSSPSPTSMSHVKQKHRAKEGRHKGKEIARWFTSYPFKDSDSTFTAEECDKEGPMKKVRKARKNSTEIQFLPDSTSSRKVPKVLKSFSHEIGPKGGLRPTHLRPHSFNDVKELLRSLRSRFDAAKEMVNTELDCFSQEVMAALDNNASFSAEGQRAAKELLMLAQQCIKMTSLEFRSECEAIVQDLSEKRQQSEAGLLKWLVTRMLFILTRCTRLLHLEKESGPVDERCVHKLKECLDKIPSVEMNWFVNGGIVDTAAGSVPNLNGDAKCYLKGKPRPYSHSYGTQRKSAIPTADSETASASDFKISKQMTSQDEEIDTHSNTKMFHQFDENFQKEPKAKDDLGSIQAQDRCSDDSDLVMCRICEELVPANHLEPHSYICAYSDNCESKCSDTNESLSKLAELLEQLIESRNSSTHAMFDCHEKSRMQPFNSAVVSEGCSPKLSESRGKGVDEMFEDLHEMDTACIEDFNLATLMCQKGRLGAKLSDCGPPSSNGSITSTSATNTPRASNFDLFWLDHSSLSELEDVQQMVDLADIARCVAGANPLEGGCHEFLLACMHDLQDVLGHSKLKALVVDTFGGRIENLLREKYILACDLVYGETDNAYPQTAKSLLDNASQSSAVSTPSHPFHKERTSIDDFEIIKPISKGAFGKVFLARKRTTGDLFAIKVLKKLDMIRKNDIERILAERNILITVRNPFVVRFYYSFTSRDNLYLVMEYLNGGDLYSLLKKVGCLEENVARTYIAELVLALEYLHSLGIVHRDLKPDNILIAQDGHIKLTDFGLSKIGLMNSTGDLSEPGTKQIALSDAPSNQNMDGVDGCQRSAVGTPDYLAPEILLGTEHGYAADWWSVGIILYELITGIPPFAAERSEIIFDNILNGKIPWPSVPDEMSYEAKDLIERLLHHDPIQRLGAYGASEVKAHSLFSGVDWDNLALQKAAFVPQPDGIDDTSYFVSRYNPSGAADDNNSTDSASSTSELSSNSGHEKMDECGDLAEFGPSPLDVFLMNFSFKNLSQLASINHDVLQQSGKDSPKCSSPSKGSNR